MRYEVDTQTNAPVVRYRVEGDGDRAVVETLLSDLTARFERARTPLLLLFDFTEVQSFDSGLRRQVAAWRGKNRALMQTAIQAVGYVITSRLVRGYLIAVNWLRPHGRTAKIFAEPESALAWLNEIAAAPDASQP
jgi:hypothetical protein